jgi:DNA polymerase III subunit delta
MTAKENKAKADEGGKAAKQASVHLLYGSDEFRMREAARALIDKLCPPQDQTFGLEAIDGDCSTIDASTASIDQCLMGLRTVGFFGSAKVVWWKDAACLGDEDQFGSETIKDKLTELVEEIRGGFLAGHHLVITAVKLNRVTSFYKKMKDLAQIQEFNLPEKSKEVDEYGRQHAEKLLKQQGIAISHEALNEFVARTGADTRTIVMEIEKLALFLGERKQATPDDVRQIVSPSRESEVWDLADRFARRDLAGSLAILRQLYIQKENHIGLMIGIENRIRELMIFKDCIRRKWLVVSGSESWSNAAWTDAPGAGDALSALGKDPRDMHPYRVKILAGQANKFSEAELKRCHREAIETHELMVGGSAVDPERLLELFLIKTLGAATHV